MKLDLILPATVDNTFRGRKIALWFFYAITILTNTRSIIHIFSKDGGAQSIATIPLNQYTTNASDTIIFIFSLWGLSQLLMGIFYIIVAVRYKSLIPLMYIFIFLEYSGRILLGHLKPIITTGIPPGVTENYIIAPLAVILFLISIKKTHQ